MNANLVFLLGKSNDPALLKWQRAEEVWRDGCGLLVPWRCPEIETHKKGTKATNEEIGTVSQTQGHRDSG